MVIKWSILCIFFVYCLVFYVLAVVCCDDIDNSVVVNLGFLHRSSLNLALGTWNLAELCFDVFTAHCKRGKFQISLFDHFLLSRKLHVSWTSCHIFTWQRKTIFSSGFWACTVGTYILKRFAVKHSCLVLCITSQLAFMVGHEPPLSLFLTKNRWSCVSPWRQTRACTRSLLVSAERYMWALQHILRVARFEHFYKSCKPPQAP